MDVLFLLNGYANSKTAKICFSPIQGLYGAADGWVLLAGGNVGASPRIAQELMSGLNDDQALQYIEKAVDFYKENAKKGERLGKMIYLIGFKSLNAAVN